MRCRVKSDQHSGVILLKTDGTASNATSSAARVAGRASTLVQPVVAGVDDKGAADDGVVSEEGNLLGCDVQSGSSCGSRDVAQVTDMAHGISWSTMSHSEWVVVTSSSSAALPRTEGVDVESMLTFELSASIVHGETSDGPKHSGRFALLLLEKDRS